MDYPECEICSKRISRIRLKTCYRCRKTICRSCYSKDKKYLLQNRTVCRQCEGAYN
ncbi:MAG: hypothetical protein QF560_03495 [SAR324 cluster bacterium]|nr:hypothetical protein [SAR324 cluster bacterium]MEE1574660.1 hypothetical protein [Deltaproteobacteria bacterium]MDP6247803.1 hypothetical protein [SAR324 cluster bacterium]MDP6330434.1 hypothetical protein [SAR324 cluster bacterium]MDP7137425.1 hypothetical protein [SAR324 cluster bacterium]